ncbi:hypothetical protein ACERII_00265 [Evansella sp. AB-rgal1]|uniref:hypothetical protein n=1 Tax=Evansella sp. AB-rgal1 TaxID=3242696 RepID=UPI00359DB073
MHWKKYFILLAFFIPIVIIIANFLPEGIQTFAFMFAIIGYFVLYYKWIHMENKKKEQNN